MEKNPNGPKKQLTSDPLLNWGCACNLFVGGVGAPFKLKLRLNLVDFYTVLGHGRYGKSFSGQTNDPRNERAAGTITTKTGYRLGVMNKGGNLVIGLERGINLNKRW